MSDVTHGLDELVETGPGESGPAAPRSGVFAAGAWRPPDPAARTIAVEDPATGELIASVASASADDALHAAAAAAAALPAWAARTAVDRAEILDRVADHLVRHRDALATTIVRENGKTYEEAAGEVDWAEGFFRGYAEEARRLTTRILPERSGRRPLVAYAPFGVVLAITPWNDPLGMIARQIAPALAAGCTVVWKPASLTPLTALRFADVLAEAGLPVGVLNLFVTDASGATVKRLLASAPIRKLVFTGSTATGLALASQAAAAGIPSNLELGGNAACIVLEDADLDAAADGIVLRKFVQAGQGCTCVNRVLVHQSVADALVERLAARVRAIKVGSGLDEQVQMGPVIRPEDAERLRALVADAVAHGATVVASGAAPDDPRLRPDAFVAPQLLAGVTDDMALAREESFGPVLPVLTFDRVDDAVDRANAVEHGLAGYVFGGRERALDVASRLEVGLLGVNDPSPQAPYYPVGGIKASGWGVAGGREGLMEYLTHRSYSIAVDGS